jgi:hypothetical protein
VGAPTKSTIAWFASPSPARSIRALVVNERDQAHQTTTTRPRENVDANTRPIL